MKLVFKAFYLFILGVFADSYKKAFDAAVDRRIRACGNIASRRLTRMSDRSCSLYMRFRSLEEDIHREMSLKAL